LLYFNNQICLLIIKNEILIKNLNTIQIKIFFNCYIIHSIENTFFCSITKCLSNSSYPNKANNHLKNASINIKINPINYHSKKTMQKSSSLKNRKLIPTKLLPNKKVNNNQYQKTTIKLILLSKTQIKMIIIDIS
jgi:hypothetical protein